MCEPSGLSWRKQANALSAPIFPRPLNPAFNSPTRKSLRTIFLPRLCTK